MAYGKKTKAGVSERLDPLRRVFPDIESQPQNQRANVARDDLLSVSGIHLGARIRRDATAASEGILGEPAKSGIPD
jgi:hypothetical protein